MRTKETMDLLRQLHKEHDTMLVEMGRYPVYRRYTTYVYTLTCVLCNNTFYSNNKYKKICFNNSKCREFYNKEKNKT